MVRKCTANASTRNGCVSSILTPSEIFSHLLNVLNYIKTPIKPTPPPSRLINEWCTDFCPICGSSMKRRWFKIIGCIQPACTNYFKK